MHIKYATQLADDVILQHLVAHATHRQKYIDQPEYCITKIPTPFGILCFANHYSLYSETLHFEATGV